MNRLSKLLLTSVFLQLTSSCKTTTIGADKEGASIIMTTKDKGFGVKLGADWDLIGEEAQHILPEEADELIGRFGDKKDDGSEDNYELRDEHFEERDDDFITPQEDNFLIPSK